MMDQEKARSSLNEQLARILNKRRLRSGESPVAGSHSSETAADFGELGQQQQQTVSQVPHHQTSTQIQNPFTFTLGTLKKQLQERGPLVSASQQALSGNESTLSAPTFQFSHTESQLIDRIFDMSADQLDSQFRAYIDPTRGPNILNQMGLKPEEFDKMTGIAKKKILINMTGLRQTVASDPNPILQETRLSTLTQLLTFADDNWLFLTPQSKDLLAEHLLTLVRRKDSTLYNAIQGNPETLLKFINVSRDLLLQGRGEEQYQEVIGILKRVFMEEGENMFHDMTLEQAPIYARAITQIAEKNTLSSKLQTWFYHGLKKPLFKKSAKTLLFQDQYAILEALPEVETNVDYYTSTKSFHYILLNEILTPSSSLAQRMETLDKRQVLHLAERCKELSKCRDINNKLRGALLYIKTQTFSIEDFRRLFEILSESVAPGVTEKKGQVDVKLIGGLLLRRNTKTAANLINSADRKELKTYFELYEFFYKKSPVAFAYAPNELKMLLARASQLAQEQHLPLQEMVTFSRTMIPSLYKPVILFTEIITNNKESFKSDVKHDDLYDLVHQIIQRAKDQEVGFEHLQLSNSRMHRHYRPFTEKSFLLLRRILDDLIKDPIKPNDLRIILKILQDQSLAEFIFKNSEHIQRVLTPTLQALTENMQSRLKELETAKRGSIFETSFEIDFTSWIETFEGLSTASFLLDLNGKGTSDNNVAVLKDQISQSAFDLLKIELQKTQSFNSDGNPLDPVFKLSKAIFSFLDNSSIDIGQYQKTQLSDIIQASLEQQFLGRKPFVLTFDKFKKNLKLSKMIQVESSKSLISSNIKEILHFMIHSRNLQGFKPPEIYKEVCQTVLPQSRSIQGDDLLNLFLMFERYGINDEVRQLMLKVSPNLMTIEQKKVMENAMEGSNKVLEFPDKRFEEINQRQEHIISQHKNMIIKHYEGIYHQQPELLKRPEASLSPLSCLMAQVFDKYKDEDILTWLQMLGSDKVENYHESFIKKLYERYTMPNVIENMATYNQKFFIKFAKHWPHFLKNNDLLNQLIQMGKQPSTLVKQQSEILHILTRLNVLHPDLMQSHFDTFMRMKDRERVAEYLKQYLHSAAVLGYTNMNAADMQKLTQLFRRLYKTPEEVPEISQLLDYFIILALSKEAYYRDFDTKSVKFLDDAIQLIEKRFTGSETLEVLAPGQDIIVKEDPEMIKLSYFKSIPSMSKVYNKVLVPQSQYREKLNMPKCERELEKVANLEKAIDDEDEEGQTLEDANSQVSQELGTNSERIIATQVDPESATPKPQKLSKKKRKRGGKKSMLQDADLFPDEGRDDVLPQEEGIEFYDEEDAQSLQAAETTQTPDFVLQEDLDAGLHAAVKHQHDEENLGKASPTSGVIHKGQKEKKIYERKASESLYSEELEFHQFRKKKLQDLDKKSKHLLLFSNINQLNFVDVNQSDLVKAWAILYHFNSKSQDSIIYDEFESLTMRNAIGKSKGHELFSKFYLKLIEASYDQGFRMHLTSKCDNTGWPIDISINLAPKDDSEFKNSTRGVKDKSSKRKQLALYFFLQEEVCLNAKEQSEEPLGLQKLMLKHLQNFSNYKVEYVTENDFYMNKDSIDDYVQYLLEEKIQVRPRDDQ